MYIGRVITSSKNIKTVDFVDRTARANSVDTSIPTLIVGKALAESLYGKDKVRILDRRIEPNLFWTYSKTEKFSEFEKDIEDFNSYVVRNLKNKVRYSYFSLFTSTLTRVKSLIRYMSDASVPKTVYIFRKHAYIHSGSDVVIGLSLEETEYLGIPTDKVIGRMRSNPSNDVITDDSFLSHGLKLRLNDDFSLIPYLYSLRKGK